LTYFNMIRSLGWLFFVLTLVHLPLFYYYSNGNGITADANFLYTTFTVGNLGQAKAECEEVSYGKPISLRCQSGSISHFTYYGVYDKLTTAGESNRCFTDFKDLETAPCAANSKQGSQFYKKLAAEC